MTCGELVGHGAVGCWSELLRADPQEWDAVLSSETEVRDWRVAARHGGYPPAALEAADDRARSRWFAGYVQSYLERDLAQLSAVSSLVDFRRLMRAACLRLGCLVNQADLGRDAGLSQSTVHRYLNLLETGHQLVRLPPYAVNRTKRLIKSPKLYWNDVGLALHLADTEPQGVHLENLVLQDLLAWRSSQMDRAEILYWRTASGREVDLVIEWKGRLLPIEAKARRRPKLEDARHVEVFLDEYADMAAAGLVLHGGDEVRWLTPRTLAVPWWAVLLPRAAATSLRPAEAAPTGPACFPPSKRTHVRSENT